MNPVGENGIEKLFHLSLNKNIDVNMITSLRYKIMAFQKSNAIFH